MVSLHVVLLSSNKLVFAENIDLEYEGQLEHEAKRRLEEKKGTEIEEDQRRNRGSRNRRQVPSNATE